MKIRKSGKITKALYMYAAVAAILAIVTGIAFVILGLIEPVMSNLDNLHFGVL